MVLILHLIALLLVNIPWVCCKVRENLSKDAPARATLNLNISNVQGKSSVYGITEKTLNIGDMVWIDVQVKVKDRAAHEKLVQEQVPMPGLVHSSFFVPQPVYISLTTMASRMGRVNRTISSLIQARVRPTMIYLMISKEPFLLDEGVKHISDELLCMVAEGYLQIVYTQNLGPHRKLLPALRRHWGKDVFIATVDDDMRRDQGYIILYQLLKHYVMGGGGNRVVALRARRIALCSLLPYKIMPYSSWPLHLAHNKSEMLVVPTGTGGILYKPSYFHKVVFHKSIRFATGLADDLMFRMMALIRRVPVHLGCSTIRQKDHIIRKCREDEYDKKYDTKYGPQSTEYFKLLTHNVTLQIQAEILVANAANATAAAQHMVATRKASKGAAATATEAARIQEHDLAATATPVLAQGGADGTRAGVLSTSKSQQLRGHRQLSHGHDSNQNELHVQLQGEEAGAKKEDAAEAETEAELRKLVEGEEERAEKGLFGDESPAHGERTVPCVEEEGEKVEDHPLNEQQRRLRKVVKYRNVPRSGNEKDLYAINGNGGNDIAWNLAVKVLKTMNVMDMEEITSAYVRERESVCYEMHPPEQVQRSCALFTCDK